MENITKEELKNLLGGEALNDDDLENISGGDKIPPEQARACADKCLKSSDPDCLNHCLGIGR